MKRFPLIAIVLILVAVAVGCSDAAMDSKLIGTSEATLTTAEVTIHNLYASGAISKETLRNDILPAVTITHDSLAAWKSAYQSGNTSSAAQAWSVFKVNESTLLLLISKYQRNATTKP